MEENAPTTPSVSNQTLTMIRRHKKRREVIYHAFLKMIEARLALTEETGIASTSSTS